MELQTENQKTGAIASAPASNPPTSGTETNATTATVTESTNPDTSNNPPGQFPVNPTAMPSTINPVITNSQPENFITTFPIPAPPVATAATSSIPPKTLWMGDIDPYSDEETIGQIWSNLGKNVLVKLIKAKKGTPAAALNTGHAGYCFIEFDTHEEAMMALSLNGTKIPNSNNRVFRLNWASSATLSTPIPQSPEYSLFVGDLAPTTTEAHLLSLFQAHFKTVKTVRVMTDPTTGASRCFGFVRFSDESERRDALIKMQGIWCAGRPLRVALATPRNASVSNVNAAAAAVNMMGGPPVGIPGSFSQDMMMYNPYGANPAMAAAAMQQYYGGPSNTPGQGGLNSGNNSGGNYSGGFSDPNNTTVFIGGLASGVPESTLLSLFQPFGAIIHVKIPPGKGCGFVKFRTREDAEAAIAGMQGFAIAGSRVRLSWGRSQNPARGNGNNGNGGSSNGMNGRNGNSGGSMGGFGSLGGYGANGSGINSGIGAMSSSLGGANSLMNSGLGSTANVLSNPGLTASPSGGIGAGEMMMPNTLQAYNPSNYYGSPQSMAMNLIAANAAAAAAAGMGGIGGPTGAGGEMMFGLGGGGPDMLNGAGDFMYGGMGGYYGNPEGDYEDDEREEQNEEQN
ncbi:Ngr1 protein [Saccharomycopsis crataegensis]|uniref:Ngr1 protein n=1 Tax=Saccharomycopsis crataegensis TaxID=43959 RepID=A0AAV5QDF3_9ASCO|nr:Ngr1 protein [Saccharomycopsis crataegensis]